jgi:hypothetical protein
MAYSFDNFDDRIDLSNLVLNFVILNNLNNNRLNPQYTFFTNGIYFVQKELSSLRILSSLHKATKSHIFYDVGSTYAIDQKINHLHNDRVTIR